MAAAQPKPFVIQLPQPQTAIKPTTYYIDDVVDARTDKFIIGKLIPAGNTGGGVKLIDAACSTTDIKQFVLKSVNNDQHLRPIIITLHNLSVNEQLSNGTVKGEIRTALSFGLKRDYDTIKLTDYSTVTRFQHPQGRPQNVGALLAGTINDGLAYFSDWMAGQANHNIKLAKAVEIVFEDYQDKKDGDTIYYNARRPLTWADFKGRPSGNSNHLAEVFSSIGYDEHAEVKAGIVKVTINLKTWLAKSACWVSDGVTGSYELNHEQRHFDLTRIVAENFKKRLDAIRMSPQNFEGEINVAYLDCLREMNDLQKRYDDETSHSRNRQKQQEWNKYIDDQLSAAGIKNS